MTKAEKDARRGRLIYIIEAAIEYFVSLSISGTFLATLTTYIGISDSTTGLIASFLSLGFSFQIVALFIPRRFSAKRLAIPGNLLEQILFTLLYVVPFFDISSDAKSVLIVVFLLVGRITANIVCTPKFAWLMGLVADNQRGKFTALKEMFSLVSGMIFTLLMGRMVDSFRDRGNTEGAFIVCAFTLAVLTVLHTLSLIFIKEEKVACTDIDSGTVKSQIADIFRSKSFWRILPVLMLWSVANYASTPFYSTYLISELAFSLFTVSLIGIFGSVARTVFSLPIGSFADRHGFSKMIMICFGIMILAFGIMIFTKPQTRILYAGYMILYSIAMAGMNSSEMNLVLDYTSRELRVGALAVKGLICGFTGFLTSLVISPLVSYVQKSGNRIFGIEIYAQQLTSVISVTACLCALIYMFFIICKSDKHRGR